MGQHPRQPRIGEGHRGPCGVDLGAVECEPYDAFREFPPVPGPPRTPISRQDPREQSSRPAPVSNSYVTRPEAVTDGQSISRLCAASSCTFGIANHTRWAVAVALAEADEVAPGVASSIA